MKVFFRTTAFIAKEIQAIVVQPQLLLLLVIGPFLVLLAFGLGYRPQGPELRAIVVQPPPGDPRQSVSYYLGSVGPPLRVVRVTSDQQAALRELQARHVDLVVVVPAGVQEMISQGKTVRLVYFHNAIDPAQVGYIAAVLDGATGELNRAIVKQAVGEQQASASDYAQVLKDLNASLAEIRSALQGADRDRAQRLARNVRLNSGLVASLWLFAAEPLTGDPGSAASLTTRARALDALLADPQSEPAALDQTIADMQATTGRLLRSVERAQKVSPDAFVAPLSWETRGIGRYQPGYVAYHSPTVLALLVQHLCITLAALSLVDERSVGAFELFRASPVKPREILVGKFAANLLVIAVTGAALVALLLFGLRVPLLGDWRWLLVVMLGLVAYSLNLGFLISAVSHSRSQAIQLSMLLLLGSIFFSGFFVPLGDFALPVRAISYSLPITYGMDELRQVILRGEPPDTLYLGVMLAWAVVLALLTSRHFRRVFEAY